MLPESRRMNGSPLINVPFLMTKLRLFYLMTGLFGGFFAPYLALLLQSEGFSSAATGSVMAVGTLLAILVQPVWGLVVDRYHITRPLLVLTFIAPAAVGAMFNSRQLVVVMVAYTLTMVFSAPQAPISDAFAVEAAGTTYGTIRSFGSLGYAIAGYVGGLYVEHLSVHTIWAPYALIGLVGGSIGLLLPAGRTEDVGVGAGLRGGLRILLTNRRFLLFLLGGFLISETLTAFNTFFVLAYKDIGGTLSTAGIAFFVASLTNVPAMLIASRVIRRVGGTNTMLLAGLIYAVRWGVQALVPIPLVAIAVQVLHGSSFGFFYVAAVDFVAQTTTRDLQATGQSVFGMVCGGAASVAGNLGNGVLLRVGGPALMYGACALASLAGAACFAWIARLEAAERRRSAAGR